jgi:plastocyanin
MDTVSFFANAVREGPVESGKVTVVGAKARRFIVKDGAGKFAAFALDAPGKVKRGDVVEWAPMPGQTHMVVSNRSSNESLQVSALALGVSRAHAEAFLKA